MRKTVGASPGNDGGGRPGGGGRKDRVGVEKVDTEMDIAVARLCLAVVFKAFEKAVVDEADSLCDGALCSLVIGKVERGRVDEGESEGRAGIGEDVEGSSPEKGGMTSAAVDKLCDRGELVLSI